MSKMSHGTCSFICMYKNAVATSFMLHLYWNKTFIRSIFKVIMIYTRVNQKVKAIFKLLGNRDREELAHCAVLTVLVEGISHVQYNALPSVEWQQRGR